MHIDHNDILANLKIDALNSMQVASLAANKTHSDVVLLSATGSGKTLAFPPAYTGSNR